MQGERRFIDDTRPEVRRMLVERWRAMTPAQKGELLSSASLAVHRIHMAGIQLRHPAAGERELEIRSAIQRLGRDVVARVVGEDQLPD